MTKTSSLKILNMGGKQRIYVFLYLHYMAMSKWMRSIHAAVCCTVASLLSDLRFLRTRSRLAEESSAWSWTLISPNASQTVSMVDLVVRVLCLRSISLFLPPFAFRCGGWRPKVRNEEFWEPKLLAENPPVVKPYQITIFFRGRCETKNKEKSVVSSKERSQLVLLLWALETIKRKT